MTNEKQQTAVEWLVSEYAKAFKIPVNAVMGETIEQAKAMEKNQKDEIENKIIHFAEWLTNKHTTTLITLFQHFEEEYYNTEEKK